MKTETQGSLFLIALRKLPDNFFAGFICGQAEKVYSGACAACMLKPRQPDFADVCRYATGAAKIYGLTVRHFANEIWILREDVLWMFDKMQQTKHNSPAYHRTRAVLCGIRDVDEKFHERFADHK